MSMEQGFRIEVVIKAPRATVWRALTDPAEIMRWFGWDYEGIVPEIQQIFVDEVTATPPERLALAWEQTIELIADGERTIVRIVKPGPLAEASWDELYDEIVRGWHGFFLQLKHYLERHPGDDRRTLWLDGTATPSAVLAALDRVAPGETWLHIRHQRVTAVPAYGRGLLAILSETPLDGNVPGKIQVTITTHGLDDGQFAELRQLWAKQWVALAPDGSVSP
jgi:uncharacterized protein YndB with AHSA1/START domain